MARLILTVPGEDVTVGGTVTVIGTTSGGEVITMFTGDISLDASFNAGGDTIVLPGESDGYSIVLSGSRAIIASSSLTVSIPLGTAGTSILFADGALMLRIDTATGSPMLGEQVITTTPQPVDDPPVQALNVVLEAGSITDPFAVAEIDRSLLISSSGNPNLTDPSAPSVELQGSISTDEEEDWFAIYLEAGETLIVDMDGAYDPSEPFEIDSLIAIFDSQENLLAIADDSNFPPDPGSVSTLDPYLEFEAPVSGIYYIVVGVFDLGENMPQDYHVLLSVVEG